MELLLYLIKEIIKILLVCGTTYVMSFGMLIVTVGKMFKTFVENGYKVNMERLKEHSQNNSSNLSKLIYIPFINVIISMLVTIKVNQEMDKAFNAMDVLGCLDELTPKEIEEYQENPTMLTALMINYIEHKYSTIEINIPKDIIKTPEDAEKIKEILNELLTSDISEEELNKKLNEISQNIKMDYTVTKEDDTDDDKHSYAYSYEESMKKFNEELDNVLNGYNRMEQESKKKDKTRTLSKPNNNKKQ